MEYVSGNIFIREMTFDTGVVEGHAHNFDHTTYVVRGTVRIEKLKLVGTEVNSSGAVVPIYEVERSVDKSAEDGHNWVLIKAGVIHRLTALTPNALAHCIYAHCTPQGDIVQEYDGWPSAYV